MLAPSASGRRLAAAGLLGAFGAVAGLVVLLAVVLAWNLTFGPPES
jgi:hypothetical protein